MPTLVVENVPAEVYERLQKRAAARKRSLPEETLHLIQHALRTEAELTAVLPEFVACDEIPAPFDLPLPESAVQVRVHVGVPPRPDVWAWTSELAWAGTPVSRDR